MEEYLIITQINDFIFCPRSIYFSGIYRNTVDTAIYHQTPQTVGKAAHKTIDTYTYSSKKCIITGLMVYSEKYNILGRIDILDTEKELLTERKYSVTAIYDGFRYQLFAQYFALLEMGYHVSAMRLHSVKDNINYDIPLPTRETQAAFEKVLANMRSFSLELPFTQNIQKCKKCIYNPICDYFQEEDIEL